MTRYTHIFILALVTVVCIAPVSTYAYTYAAQQGTNTSTQNFASQTTDPNVNYGVDCQIYFSTGSNGTVTLNWRSLNATSGTITPSVGQVNPTSGSVTVNPTYGQMYSLTAFGPGGGATCMSDPYTGSAQSDVQTYYTASNQSIAQNRSDMTSIGYGNNTSGDTNTPSAIYTASVTPTVERSAPMRDYGSSVDNSNTSGSGNSQIVTHAVKADAPTSVTLSQVPYTGVDSDILMTAIVLLGICLTIVGIVYILYRTGILFIILGLY